MGSLSGARFRRRRRPLPPPAHSRTSGRQAGNPSESRLEGGEANVKFINFKHNLQAGVSVRNKVESEREGKNKSQANRADDTVICFTEVRFLQTYSPLRWSQRPGLFQPFPSLKRSPRPSELFSLINGSLRPLTRTTTTWCLLL
jgi:hypothetical protein